MDRQPARRSSLFLMELIIAILFFSLAATICVRIFVKSHALEQESVDLNHAVNAATSVAEIFRSQENVYSVLQEHFPTGELAENAYHIFYDTDWNLCGASDADYIVTLHTKPSAPFLLGTVDVTHGENALYQLDLKKYMAQEEF